MDRTPEYLTHELIQKATALIEEVEQLGGMTRAIEHGIPKMRIEEAAAAKQARIDAGIDVIVGVNKYQNRRKARLRYSGSEQHGVRDEQIAG